MIVHGDFEACSVLNLDQVGPDVWTSCAETHAICFSYAIDDGPVSSLVFDRRANRIRGNVLKLLEALDDGAEFHAWNAPFEFLMWNNLMVPRWGWPKLSIEQFHCTMARAACAGLPMSLDLASVVLYSPYPKDRTGHALMKRMARPRAMTPRIVWWHEVDDAKLNALVQYNIRDVETERDVANNVPRMSRNEREIWLLDQRMNQRGLPVDLKLLDEMDRVITEETGRLNREVRQLTHGEVSFTTQAGALLMWLQRHGYPYDNLQRATIERYLESPNSRALSYDAQTVLAHRFEAAKTSTAKINSVRAYAMKDGVARHLTQYGGAVRTLRWAGRGPQIQNFPRPTIKNVDHAIELILAGLEADNIAEIAGAPMTVVSSCLRGVFRAPPGKKFVVCDYSAIEARVLAWLAEHEVILDVFRRGEDVYMFEAKRQGSNDRTFGKVLVLALGYGMGPDKFLATAQTYGVTLTVFQAEHAVTQWRENNRPIKNLWYMAQHAAVAAIENPGHSYRCGKYLSFCMARPDRRLRGALLLTLPSGRNLVYRNARLEIGDVSYDGISQYTHQWGEIRTYGAKLIENATQAIARDLLADALLSLSDLMDERLLQTVHDEIIAMDHNTFTAQTVTAMRIAMTTPPTWAKGLPLDVKHYVSERLRKD